MKLETISFLFGAILLLVGILGGGFEVRELKIPKVSWVPRLLSAVAGFFFVMMGIGLIDYGKESPEKENPPSAKPDAGIAHEPEVVSVSNTSCDFIIFDELTQDAISEQLTVMIDGKLAGTITASEQYPQSVLNVNVEKPGKYSYTIDGSITAYDDYGTVTAFPCAGQGMINAAPGKRFSLAASFSGNTILITLVEGVN